MTLSLNKTNELKHSQSEVYQYDIQWLDFKLTEISKANLEKYSEKEKFAFYINTYNILTLWSVKKKLQSNPSWKGNTTLLSKIRFFYLSKFIVAGKKINLFNLENKILRKKFKDPRIHFVINCASISCPPLPNKQINAQNLNKQLEEFTNSFINDGINVQYDNDNRILKINPIFKWYKNDFESYGGTINFIKKYYKKITIQSDVKVIYLDYDWNLRI